ncbi:MAG: hypothetical protein ACRDGN_09335 [bacterium]
MTVRTGIHVALVLVLTSAAGQAGARPGADPWLIVPGVRVGAITRAAGELDLIRAYGRGNVRNQNIEMGEGVLERGTVVFPDEPLKSAAILWRDLINNRMPERIQITGSTSVGRAPESPGPSPSYWLAAILLKKI